MTSPSLEPCRPATVENLSLYEATPPVLQPLAIIQTFVVPAVMISANGLLCLAFYNRLTAVVGRSRTINKERFDLFARWSAMEEGRRQSAEATHLKNRMEVLDELGHQLYHRARLVRDALLCLLVTILCMLGCSLALGLAPLWNGLDIAALTLFVAGAAVMFLGILNGILELWITLDPLLFEHDRIEQSQEDDTWMP